MPIKQNSIKIVIADLKAFALLVVFSVGLGVGINFFRTQKSPFFYESRETRMRKSADKYLASHPHSKKTTFPWITVEELISFSQEPGVFIFDARPSHLYKMGHIPNALNLSRENFETDYQSLPSILSLPNAKKIVVYCSDINCDDSQVVAEKLTDRGMQSIYLFKEGWKTWEQSNHSIEK